MSRKRKRVPFVVGFGGESFLLDRMLERARAKEGSVTLQGEAVDAYELVDELSARTFDGSDRVVVLDNAQKVKGKALEEYIDEKDPADTGVQLIAAVRSETLPKVWTDAAAKGRSLHFPKFKPWEKDKKVRRVVEEAARLKLTLEVGLPELFLKVLGDDLGATVNELEKLTYLVKEGETVTKAHAAKVITHMFPASPFEVAEAAMAKNSKKAMRLLSFLFKHVGEGASVPITISLMRQAEKLVIARQCLDRGETAKDVAGRLGMHEYACKVNVLPLAQKHTLKSLVKLMTDLCALETQVKGPARSKRTLVELAVLSIAA